MTIFIMDCREVAALPDDYLQETIPIRYQAATAIHCATERLRSLSAGLLLHQVLKVKDENRIQRGEFGKPFITGGPEFNLSHSGDYAALVADEQPVGVDMEHPRRIFDCRAMGKKILTEQEQLLFSIKPNQQEFLLMMWVLKESVMKATGLGMSLDPKQITALPIDPMKPHMVHQIRWYSALGEYDGYTLACTARHEITNLSIRKVSPAGK